MAWLTLTAVDGSTIYVNMDRVVSITATKLSGSALLTDMTGKEGAPIVIRVRQSPGRISDMVMGVWPFTPRLGSNSVSV